MSRHGEVMIAWGDGEGPGESGEYRFRIGIEEWDQLDRDFNVGPYEILRRISTGIWKRKEVRAVIRIALVAGGSVKTSNGAVDDDRVRKLVREFVDDRPQLQSVAVAARILEAALFGPQDDPLPKSQAVERAVPISQTGDSPSPPSMDGDRSSAIRPPKSGRSRSGSSTSASPDTNSPTGQNQRPPPQVSTNSTT